MEAAKNLFLINIVFFLIQFVTYMNAECNKTKYTSLPAGVNIHMAEDIQPVFEAEKLNNTIKCGQMCANEKFCNVWRFGLGNCQIFHSVKDKVTVRRSTNTSTKTYYETGEGELQL